MKISHLLFTTLAGLAAARPVANAVPDETKRQEPVQYCTPDTEGQPCVFTGAASTQVIGVCSRSTKRSTFDLPVGSAEGLVGDGISTVGSQCEPTYVNEVAVEDDVDDTVNTSVDGIYGVTDVARRQVPQGFCSQEAVRQTCVISRDGDATVTGVCSTKPNPKRWSPANTANNSVKSLAALLPYECLPVDDSSEANGAANLIDAGEDAADGATGGVVRR